MQHLEDLYLTERCYGKAFNLVLKLQTLERAELTVFESCFVHLSVCAFANDVDLHETALLEIAQVKHISACVEKGFSVDSLTSDVLQL